MPVMLFKLRGVEDDEAEEIRALLAEHDVDYYETTNGRWGLGFAAIWLHDEHVYEHAKALIDEYQRERCLLAREAYEQLRLAGKHQTFWSMLKDRPLQVFLTVIAILIVCLFVLSPFVVL